MLGPLTLLLDDLGIVLKWMGVVPDRIGGGQNETQKSGTAQQNRLHKKRRLRGSGIPPPPKMVQKLRQWSSDAPGNNKPAVTRIGGSRV
ncbi:hypothetical protein EGY17_00985 (plasmid) [Escherichia coli]|nr:hypothetical protein EGY17_00985 [Escherichia coli]EEW9234509.1 hypothetical protein [Escherichia coli]